MFPSSSRSCKVVPSRSGKSAAASASESILLGSVCVLFTLGTWIGAQFSKADLLAQSGGAGYTEKMLERFTPDFPLDHGYHAYRLDTPMPIPGEIGEWLLSEELYSRGNDFTNAWSQDPAYIGESSLKKIWQGRHSRKLEGANIARLWVIAREGEIAGVISWAGALDGDNPVRTWIDEVPPHPNHNPKRKLPVAFLGHVMCFQKKEHRGQGLVKHCLSRIAPEIEALARKARSQGDMPFVAASDAVHKLLGDLTDVPVLEEISTNQKGRADVWRKWTSLRMFPEDENPQADFLVPAHPWVKPGGLPKRRSP